MNDKETKITDHVPSGPELISLYKESEENNPKSIYFKRVLVRPSISLIETLFNILIPLLLVFIMAFLLRLLTDNPYIYILCPILLLVIYCIIRLKSIVIWCVKCYQRFAPDSVRNKCRFVPSCSEYMIKGIEKYGVCKGFCKGIDRICRCKSPNGGYDEP